MGDDVLAEGTKLGFVGVWVDREGHFRAGRGLRWWAGGHGVLS
jgi:hypothetical protein